MLLQFNNSNQLNRIAEAAFKVVKTESAGR
jgi:hypothetical protein